MCARPGVQQRPPLPTAPEQTGEAESQHGEGEPRNVLIGAQGNAHAGVQQGGEAAHHGRGQDAEPGHLSGVGHGESGKGAQDHHAFDTQVDDPGALGADFAERGP
jgi:hypothetical protein